MDYSRPNKSNRGRILIMCIIIVKQAGVELKEEWMDNSAKNNPHGFGLSFVNEHTKELEVHKTLEYEAFKLIYEEALQENPNADFVLHFRKNTCGETTEDNCHPFQVADGLVLYHNGTIKPLDHKNKDEKRSDTRIFAEEIAAYLPYQWERNAAIHELIEHYIGESKLVTMDAEGHIEIINEEKGSWEEGLWVSNWSYFPSTRSLQKIKPAYWTANIEPPKKIRVLTDGSNFFRWESGVKYRWDNTFRGWRACNSDTDEFIYGQALLFGDNPVYDYNLPAVISTKFEFIDIKVKQLPFKQERARQKNGNLGECDWCAGICHKDLLQVVACMGKSGVSDISLMCRKCTDEFAADGS